jgi:hypothetical protein
VSEIGPVGAVLLALGVVCYAALLWMDAQDARRKRQIADWQAHSCNWESVRVVEVRRHPGRTVIKVSPPLTRVPGATDADVIKALVNDVHAHPAALSPRRSEA